MGGESDPAGSARIEAFSVSRLLVVPGETVDITWAVADAGEVALYANDTRLETGGRLEGSVSHVIEEETRFRLEAGAGENKASRQILVGVREVDESALILSFVADPLEIDAGEPTRLAWVTRNAAKVEIFDEGGQAVPLGAAAADQGSVEVHPDGNTVYRLVAQGEEGSVERMASVKVRGQPEVETGVSNTAIAPGEAVTLSWSVLDALRVVVREVEGAVLVDTELSLEGSVEVQPSRSTTYEIRGVGAWRDTVETVRVEVAPKILAFELVAEGPIGLGKMATLRWETAGASQLRLSNLEGAEETIGGFRVDEGSTRIAMGSGGRFRLTAIGGNGEEVEETISGELLGLPTIASFGVSPEVQSAQTRAVTATVSWAGIENAERVKLETDTLGRVGIFEAPFEDGALDLFLTETTNFTITVSNGAGEVTRTATATVVPLPVIDAFTIFPAHAAVGEEVTLQWEVDRASSIAIEFNGEPLPVDPTETQGSHVLTASEEGTFRLVATNSAGGAVERSRALTIGPPLVTSFGASESVLTASDPLTLSWSARGGIELTLLEDGVPIHVVTTPDEIANGALTLPSGSIATLEYTVRLENGLGDTDERSLEVLRTDGPVILSVAATEFACRGEEVTIDWTAIPDMHGKLPDLTLSIGEREYDLSGLNPVGDSFSLHDLPTGNHHAVLTAQTPGTTPHAQEFFIEVDETRFVAISADPAVAAVSDEVTVTWETVCADAATLVGQLEPVEVFDSPFVDIWGGTSIPIPGNCNTQYGADDEGCVVLDFPTGFTFPFDGVEHTAIKLFANGVAGFDLLWEGESWENQALPATSASWVNFALFWDDLFMGAPNFWHEPVTGSTGQQGLLIQWQDLSPFALIQMVLWEDGSFDYRYDTSIVALDESFVVIGYQNATGSRWGALSQYDYVPGGLAGRTWRFEETVLPASGSHTFKAVESMEFELEAIGVDGRVSASVEIVVQ